MKNKCVVDERQRVELLEVEHYGFWTLFIVLIVVILAQLLVAEPDWRSILGEGIAVFLGGGVLVVGCIRRGLWDYSTQPTKRIYAAGAGIAAIIVALLGPIVGLVRGLPVNMPLHLAIGAGTFAVTYAVLWWMGSAVLRRRKALERETDEGERRG